MKYKIKSRSRSRLGKKSGAGEAKNYDAKKRKGR